MEVMELMAPGKISIAILRAINFLEVDGVDGSNVFWLMTAQINAARRKWMLPILRRNLMLPAQLNAAT